MAEFETGAVRSSDADSYAYSLITPIGLERVAKRYAYSSTIKNITINEFLNECIYSTMRYLRGDRDIDYLAFAAVALFEAMHIEETGKCNLIDIEEKIPRYDLISSIGLRRVAATYREGEIKYAAYNCEKGFPIHDLLNHALKHIYDYLDSNHKRTEDDLAHAAWGYLMAMHSEEKWPELNEAWLRGPNCTLTEPMLKRIEKEIKAKRTVNINTSKCKTDGINEILDMNFEKEQDRINEASGEWIVDLVERVEEQIKKPDKYFLTNELETHLFEMRGYFSAISYAAIKYATLTKDIQLLDGIRNTSMSDSKQNKLLTQLMELIQPDKFMDNLTELKNYITDHHHRQLMNSFKNETEFQNKVRELIDFYDNRKARELLESLKEQS